MLMKLAMVNVLFVIVHLTNELKLCFLSLYELDCMPVLVFTGGAAVKAGVQEGDRIIKVFTTFHHRH